MVQGSCTRDGLKGMIDNADITIINKVVGADRREKFVPTRISGACWYDVRSMSQAERHREGSSRVVIRIPYSAKIEDDKIYLPEEDFKRLDADELGKYWTIQKNAYVLRRHIVQADKWLFDPFSFRYGKITELLPEELNRLRSEDEDFFTIVEYADNTQRGSLRTKHWRIGGA